MARNRALALTLLLLTVATTVWLIAEAAGTPPPDSAGHDNLGTPAILRRDGAQSESSSPAGIASPVRVEVDAEPTDATSPPDRATFFGRVIHSDNRLPLAGATVTVRRTGSRSDARETGTITTGDDGAFEIEATFDSWLDTLTAEVTAPGCVPRRATFRRPTPDSRIDLGDIPLQRSISVTGRIVDNHGAPVPHARLMFVYLELGNTPKTAAENSLRANSDAHGRFTFDIPAFAGEWWVGTEYTGALIEPRSVKLGPELTEYELHVVTERPDPDQSITGIVVDEANRPMADVHISANGGGYFGRGRSGTDGRFEVPRGGPMPSRNKPEVSLSCSSPDRMHRRVAPGSDATIVWGQRDVEIVMQRRQSCRVRVVDQAGAPVEDFALFAFRGQAREQSRLSLYGSLTQRGRHQDGRCTLVGLDPGENSVLVVPRDRALPPSGFVPFVVQAGAPTSDVVVTLPSQAALSIQLVTPTGRALPDSTLEVIVALGRGKLESTSKVYALSDIDRARGTPGHVLFGSATTDGDGRAKLRLAPGRYTLRATSPSHVPLIESVEVFAPVTTKRLTAMPAARIIAELGPATAVEQLRELGVGGDEPLAVIAKRSDGDTPPAIVATEVDAENAATIGGLTAGRYEIAARYWLTTSPARSGSVTLEVATIDLSAGDERTVKIDVAQLLPATARGRVVAGGEPLRDVHCFLRAKDRSMVRGIRGLRVATDSDGRYVGLVPPGEYGFSITYPAQPGPGWVVIELDETWTLAPGDVREQNFDFPLRRAGLRITGADDQPVVGHIVRIRQRGYHLPGRLVTDANGRVEVFPAPLRPFQVEVREPDSGSSRTMDDVDLPPGKTSGEVELRLPGG